MAAAIIPSGGIIPHHVHVLRALNPKHLENGLPGDNHFVMKRTHSPGDGVSTGLDGLISLQQLRGLDVIRQVCGEQCGVAHLHTSEILAPVSMLGITVIQQDDTTWGAFAGAHAVITGYQPLMVNNEGRRQIREFQRHLGS